jgi:hypothetical protein
MSASCPAWLGLEDGDGGACDAHDDDTRDLAQGLREAAAAGAQLQGAGRAGGEGSKTEHAARA